MFFDQITSFLWIFSKKIVKIYIQIFLAELYIVAKS